MTVLIIGGGSLGAALAAVLRDSGVAVVAGHPRDAFEPAMRRVAPLDDMLALMRDADQLTSGPLMPYPLPRMNLPKRSSWQVPGLVRSSTRPRERRTRGQK